MAFFVCTPVRPSNWYMHVVTTCSLVGVHHLTVYNVHSCLIYKCVCMYTYVVEGLMVLMVWCFVTRVIIKASTDRESPWVFIPVK